MDKNKDFNVDEIIFPEDYFPKIELPKYDDEWINIEDLLGFSFVEFIS